MLGLRLERGAVERGQPGDARARNARRRARGRARLPAPQCRRPPPSPFLATRCVRADLASRLDRTAAYTTNRAARESPCVGSRIQDRAMAEEVVTRFAPSPDRLPPHRRRPHGAVQLALRPPFRRPHAAADRGHRPRALDAGGDRRHPRRAGLVGPQMGRRRRLPVRARRAAPRGGRATARRGPRLSLLDQPGRARRDARRWPRRRSGRRATTGAGATAIPPRRRRAWRP